MIFDCVISQLINTIFIWRHPPLCEKCQEIITMKHLLFHCTMFINQRRKYNLEGQENNSNKSEWSFINNVIQFLLSTNLYNKL